MLWIVLDSSTAGRYILDMDIRDCRPGIKCHSNSFRDADELMITAVAERGICKVRCTYGAGLVIWCAPGNLVEHEGAEALEIPAHFGGGK